MNMTKYYQLCCNHTCIEMPCNCFDIPDDYKFMKIVETELNVKHVGNFRKAVALGTPPT